MPVIWISIAFVLGIVTADSLTWSLFTWLGLGVGLCIFLVISNWIIHPKLTGFSSGMKSMILGVVLAFILGAARYKVDLPDFKDPTYLTNFTDLQFPVVLTGVVTDFPDRRDQLTNLCIKAEFIQKSPDGESIQVRGILLAKVPVEEAMNYGDRVQIKGYLNLPPEGEEFSYRDYLKRQDIYVYFAKADLEVLESDQGYFLLKAIFLIKTRALDILYQLWPDPEASLLAGILLGVESGISEVVQKTFRETGTTHIIAISGFNITIVAGFSSRFFSRVLNPRRGALAA